MFQSAFTGSFDGILSDYKKDYNDITSNRIPIPDDFPEESIPRLEIQHASKGITLRFAKSRGDIFFTNDVDNDVLNDFLSRVVKLGITIGRIGYARNTVFSGIDLDFVRSKLPMLSVVKSNDDILEATQKFNKKTVINCSNEEIYCNNIAALTLGKNEGDTALLLERDVNTTQDKNLGIQDVKAAQSIIRLLGDEASKTLFEIYA